MLTGEASVSAWDTQQVSDASQPAGSLEKQGFAALYMKSHSYRLLKTVIVPIGVYQLSAAA